LFPRIITVREKLHITGPQIAGPDGYQRMGDNHGELRTGRDCERRRGQY